MRNVSILMILISGLILTSLIKNKTRLLEKELANLNKEITILSSNLIGASLEFEYLSTPKNILLLSKNFLDENFSYYKKSQLKKSIKLEKDLTVELNENNSNLSKKINNGQLLIAKKIDTEIVGDAFTGEETVKYFTIFKKLKNDNTVNQFSVEESVNMKSNIAKEINNGQSQEPKEIAISKKVPKWVGLQIIKSFLGIPAMPLK